MFAKCISICTMLTLFVLLSQTGEAQSQGASRNDIGLELLGRTGNWNIAYQHRVIPEVGLQLGLVLASGLGSGAAVIPIGGSIYPFSFDYQSVNISPFLSGGYVWIAGVTNKFPLLRGAGPTLTFFDDTGGWMYAGTGWDNRFENGFLVRANVYYLAAEGESHLWPGLFIGFSF